MTTLKLKRVYEPPSQRDGFRILVDRLWPRGLAKEEAKVNLWLKEVAPSSELRKWFGHDEARWERFEERYFQELDENPAVEELRNVVAHHRTVTLLFGAKDTEHNNAVALRDYLSG